MLQTWLVGRHADARPRHAGRRWNCGQGRAATRSAASTQACAIEAADAANRCRGCLPGPGRVAAHHRRVRHDRAARPRDATGRRRRRAARAGTPGERLSAQVRIAADGLVQVEIGIRGSDIDEAADTHVTNVTHRRGAARGGRRRGRGDRRLCRRTTSPLPAPRRVARVSRSRPDGRRRGRAHRLRLRERGRPAHLQRSVLNDIAAAAQQVVMVYAPGAEPFQALLDRRSRPCRPRRRPGAPRSCASSPTTWPPASSTSSSATTTSPSWSP